MDDKLLYLAKTLSRTKRKDFENYVVNAVWNRIASSDLKPVSQQYVVKPDGGHYLIDLYFPQLNIGIECDEGYHKAQTGRDAERELTIADVLNRIKDTLSYRALHVDITKSFDAVEKQIDDHVRFIKSQLEDLIKNGTFVPWGNKTAEEYFAGKASITVGDDIAFATASEACNTILGTNYEGLQRSYFIPYTLRDRFGDRYRVWFPPLAVEGKALINGWNNQLAADGSYIVVFNEDGRKNETSLAVPDHGEDRIVFTKIKNPLTNVREYRFAGVFRYSHSIDGKNYYDKIADDFAIIRNSD